MTRPVHREHVNCDVLGNQSGYNDDGKNPEIIHITHDGPRGGTYYTLMTPDNALVLMMRLANALDNIGAAQGFTHPAYVRLKAWRQGNGSGFQES